MMKKTFPLALVVLLLGCGNKSENNTPDAQSFAADLQQKSKQAPPPEKSDLDYQKLGRGAGGGGQMMGGKKRN